MLFFVLGPPGGFTAWCESVVTELLRRAGGPAAAIRADTLEQIAVNALAAGVSWAAVGSHCPGGRLRAALVESGVRFIVVLDDPRSVLVDLVLRQQTGLADAVQRAASSSAALAGLAAAPGALVLDAARDRRRPTDTVARIARHLELPLPEQLPAELAGGIARYAPSGSPQEAIDWWNGLDRTDQELAVGALVPFIGTAAEDTAFSVRWGRELFFLGDRTNERVGGPIDITGRARCLVHGPHITLPPGAWSLSLTALLQLAAAEHDFLVEIWAERTLASGSLRAQPDGTASVTLTFAVDAATEHPISVRISSRRAAFDGAIVIMQATAERERQEPIIAVPEEPLLADL